jgi:hypothetical protein
MTDDEALSLLGGECPRKIMGRLHAQGLYVHGTSVRFPGKILCFHKDSPLPDDWVPTPAQARLWQEHGPVSAPAAHG